MLHNGTPSPSKRIAIDAMGGDLGPAEVIAGLHLALRENAALNPVTLVGDRAVLDPIVAAHPFAAARDIKIHHASQVIGMDEKPIAALKQKKDASMVRAIELVKNNLAGAVLSSGNTGALMACGTLRLRTLPGVDRPALAAIVPRENGVFIILDVGASPDAEPANLVHNAILGAHYARDILGEASPRVALLTIGAEEGKGTKLTVAAHEILKNAAAANLLNYTGQMEGFELFRDHADIVLCDGFTGNVLIKSWESLARFFTGTLKGELKANPLRLAGALLGSGAFKAIKRRTNPERYNGAPLLGLRGNVLKSHGSSNRQAIKHAILAANRFIETDFLHHIETDIARVNALMSA
ncbi:MAG: phosphate acyltransferase PlsX [Opitutaceae bacterium]|jgi:glycerol-3-phosphate acyltransferase PlsX|nr:phosphate acyltransferase PlsX [Opitutaceae bacterium]